MPRGIRRIKWNRPRHTAAPRQAPMLRVQNPAMEQKTPASKVNTEAGGRATINMADHTKARAEIEITTTPEPTARVPGSRADIEEPLNNFSQT